MIHESIDALRADYRYRIDVVDDAAWEVLEIPGPGTPVVFLAGGQGTAEVFFKPMLRLAGDHAMLGAHYPELTDAPALASGLVQLMDRLGHGQFSIVGSSFGAYIAQFVAAHWPERIDRLVLGNTFVDAGPAKSIPLFNQQALEGISPHDFKAARLAAIEEMQPAELRPLMQDQMGVRQSAQACTRGLWGLPFQILRRASP